MIGKRLAHYEILEKIGAGGMGEVFRARDTKLDRYVAVKVLPPQIMQDPERRMRFEREAKAVAALRHPNIVTIYSVEEGDGVAFFTMELLEGGTLAESIPPEGFELGRYLELAIGIADAVGLAHTRGIVHRDLKPGNIVLEHGRQVKVLDFGLAKLMTGAVEHDSATMLANAAVTGEGRVLGTAAYMAPEQAEGKPTDARSDVFALGIIFYEMLTGRRPFQGSNEITTLSAILRDTPPAITELKPTLPRHLGRIIKRCLEKAPDRRYETARAVRLDLETLREELQGGVPSELESSADPSGSRTAISNLSGPASTPQVPAARRGRPAWLVPVTTLVVVGVVAAALLLRSFAGRGRTEHPKGGSRTASDARTASSTIVVFPFENLGPPEDAYFAAGMTDEVMGRLARVQGLAVLSRTTATHYDRKGKRMQDIVADLGVQYVLDGTVRWERLADGKSRVRVSPQLVRTSDDTQMWTSSYDRGMEDIFSVQSDIASEVVSKLGLTLLGGAGAPQEDAPTKSVEAYQAYLRGKDLAEQSTDVEDSWRVSLQMFERAVSFDPGFVRAHALLSRARSGLRHYDWDRSEQNLARAKADADTAVRLAPDSPWGHMALGYYYYWGRKEYDQATQELEIADRLLPGQAEFIMPVAFIRRRQGRFAEAAQILARSEKLDPRNTELLFTIGETATILGRYAQADSAFDAALQLAPDMLVSHLDKALGAELAGDAARAIAILNGAPLTSNAATLRTATVLEYHARRFDRALALAAQLPDLRDSQFGTICRPLVQARIYSATQHPDQATQAFEAARLLLEQHLTSSPDDANARSALGLAYAGLGRKDDAVREATRALGLYPSTQDLWYRQWRLYDLVCVYILIGDRDAAVAGLNDLLSKPTDQVSPGLLRVSPQFDSLRDDPGFARLLQRAS